MIGVFAKRDLLGIAELALPGVDVGDGQVVSGDFHDVVLLPGRAVVKVARGTAAAHLPRRVELLRRLAEMGLPFATPVPLSDVVAVGDRRAVALSWVVGEDCPAGTGDPAELRRLLAALAEVPVDELAACLDRPHAYAGRDAWPELMLDEVVPRLPPCARQEARRRIGAALDLPPVPATLVHGDLAGQNVRWNADGTLAGVIDWDLAQAFDPAIDAACLAWHGWEAVRAAVDAQTYERARTWFLTFGIEQVAAVIDNGEPASVIEACVVRAARWIEETSD